MNEMFSLSGKIAVVTGGSRGLGKAIALGLARSGADVVIADILERESKETVKEIEKLGRRSMFVKTDVSKGKDAENMVKKTVEKFKRIDILVNNAGVYKATPMESVEENEWDRIMDVNVKGQFLCAKEVGEQMIRQRSGKIINIASVAGEFAFAQSTAYNSSKAGVILLTKTLALEWAKHNIQVNAIAPGVFQTTMTAGLIKDEEFRGMIKNRVPLGRSGEPNELVGAAIFLASDASSYVTGSVITVDGGWTAGL
jgi:NAD(P)-dependent dehydrogenase (short-subunit alcohol dehydrogenase family)